VRAGCGHAPFCGYGVERSLASKSLGPFPKALRWHEIVGRSGAGSSGVADEKIDVLLKILEELCEDPVAIRAVMFLVALPVCTRDADPYGSLRGQFGIELQVGECLAAALDRFLPGDHLAKRALAETWVEFEERYREGSATLFDVDEWAVWRSADGSGFCDLAMLFFRHLNEQLLACVVPSSPELTRFAHECAIITRSFSARWFNACARYQVPEAGSIKWYLGHCLGKVDLELSRERSDWVEPSGNPWRRKRPIAARLEL
jgi:hypothetical protein